MAFLLRLYLPRCMVVVIDLVHGHNIWEDNSITLPDVKV